jgi:hypothetical protein
MPEQQVTYPNPVIDKGAAKIVAGGSFSETVTAMGAIAIAIIALVGVLPTLLAAIAAIVTGAALLMEGSAISARMAREIAREGFTADSAELAGGLTSEFIAGAAGVVLGILSLLSLAPMTLLAVAAVTLGGGLVMGSMVSSEVRHVQVAASEPHYARHAIERAVSAANGVRAMFGLGAVTLGILALIYPMASLILSLIAYLVVGVSVMLSGSAVGAKMMSAMRHS